MYRTCLFCRGDLGANVAIETLPIGRRLAFDRAEGRLWVVCRGCERWNLTPFDERWEAIEACEKAYRDTPRRFATDNIGLARLPDGLELVRIGQPLRPEFAAWRYGDQFGRRHRRNLVLGAAVTVGGVGLFIAPWLTGVSVLGSAFGVVSYAHTLSAARKTAAVIDGPDQQPIPLISAQLGSAQLSTGPESDHPVLRVPHRTGRLIPRDSTRDFHRLEGESAIKAVGKILPAINAAGGGRRVVAAAANLLDDLRDPTTHFAALARRVGKAKYSVQRALSQQPKELRLALEMAAHEQAERAWLAGELLDLEAAWRDADALAKVADSLAVPDAVEGQLKELKERKKR